jgi:hypothetical protein
LLNTFIKNKKKKKEFRGLIEKVNIEAALHTLVISFRDLLITANIIGALVLSSPSAGHL